MLRDFGLIVDYVDSTATGTTSGLDDPQLVRVTLLTCFLEDIEVGLKGVALWMDFICGPMVGLKSLDIIPELFFVVDLTCTRELIHLLVLIEILPILHKAAL